MSDSNHNVRSTQRADNLRAVAEAAVAGLFCFVGLAGGMAVLARVEIAGLREHAWLLFAVLAAAAAVGLGAGIWTAGRHASRLRARQQTSENELRQRERDYRRLIECSPDAIFRLDASTRFSFFSAGGCAPLASLGPGLLGQPFHTLGGESSEVAAWDARIRDARQTGQVSEGELVLSLGATKAILNVRLLAEDVPDDCARSVLGFARDITQHRQAERDYRQIFGSMLDGFALHEIICDEGGRPIDYRFLAVNPAFERLTGLKAVDIVGRRVLEVLPRTEPRWIEDFGRVALSGEPFQFENYSGELNRHFEVAAFCPLPGQFGCIFADVTQRRLAEAALKDREARYRVLVNALSDALFVHEIDAEGRLGRFVEVNEEACRRLGYPRELLLTMSPADIDAPGTASITQAAVDRILAGDDVSFETVHVSRGGTRIPVEIRCCLTRLQGRASVISIVRDITERRRLESENRKVQEQIQHVQKLEGLGLLAGGIAHDFNNLLMAILGNADLALDDLPAGAPGRQNVGEIKSISVKAADLCRQLLAYSGKGKFVVEPLDLAVILEDMSHLLTVSVSKKALIKYNLTPGLPRIVADAAQIRQVIMNLVINASEAIGERSGVIVVNAGAAECDAEYLRSTYLNPPEPGLYVTLEVSDTGAGMDAETRARIFDPFFTTKFTGRGLGLAAVLGIVRGHRGAIKVYSEPGRGTSFKVMFPATVEVQPGGAPDAEEAPWRGSGMVLLVDDEEPLLALGKQMLERIGFSVVTAQNGRQALQVFEAMSRELTLVLMDLTMPHMDGDAACREMRKLNAAVPVVLTSGYNEQELAERMAGRSATGFIQKPYSRPALSRVLKSVLGAPRR